MSRKTRVWGLELVIVIAIPLATVIAGIATLIIASSSGFQPGEAQLDRFARPQPESTE